MNNEPVGYFRKNYDGDWVEADAGYEDEVIPLYTHPAKALTDEEITQIVSEKLETWNTKEAMINFAREILKKASEK